jgi:uroporphyrinogen decarboxylase
METMSPRERFLAALRVQPTDRVPIWDWVNNPALYQHALGQTPKYYDGRLAARLSLALGLDACWVPDGGFMGLPSARWQWQDDARYTDEWDTGYQIGAGSWPLAFPIRHPIHNADGWNHLCARLPDPDASRRSDFARDALVEAKQEIAVVAGIRGPFSSAWMLMGLEQMSLALFEQPNLLNDVLRVTADFWTRCGLRLIEQGVDAIVVHDDQGSNDATIFAPARFRQFILPHLKREIETLRATGAPIILHSCGNINAILPDLVGTGIAGLNNLQRAARMDLRAVKAQYGGALCLIGNVDATGLLPTATSAQVEQAVIECLEIGAPGGGYILATDHSFHEGIPIENVLAFIAAGKRHGGYR